MSIDALRGFDMMFIMGFSSLIVAICSLFPNGADCWLAETMVHAKWDGLSHHDTIFPLFLCHSRFRTQNYNHQNAPEAKSTLKFSKGR